MKSFERESLIKALQQNVEWDVFIIGGGATGLGLAVDAATRGYSTLLAEQEDFSKGTSSRSTKLVHGGVRYLAQGNIRLVREALKERGLLLNNVPHLTQNKSFIIPCYSWWRGIFYALGLKVYDWMSGKWSLGKSEWISRKAVLKKIPAIRKKGLKCGILYHDGTFDDARLAINLAQTAIENGAEVLNYCKVTGLKKNDEGMICGAQLLDVEAQKHYEVKARVVINATGVFADDILQLDIPGASSIIRPSQGIHLVLDHSFLQSEDAIMIPRTPDGRVLFAIPWHGKVLAGTTDTPLNSHSLEPRAMEQEIDFILENAGQYLALPPSRTDILSVFAGLRPLAATEGHTEKTKEISRSHKILLSTSGLVSVIGGKWTTYRKMAEDTLDKVIRKNMLPVRECMTAHFRIHGYDENESNEPLSWYGADAQAILNLMKENPEWSIPLTPHAAINGAQVIWGIRNEMARTVEDILARRTRLLFVDARAAIDAAPKVAEIMKEELGYDESWKTKQLESFVELAEAYLVKGSRERE